MVIGAVSIAFQIYYVILLARVIFSWVPLPTYHPLKRALHPIVFGLTEPLLAPIRSWLRPYQGGMPLDLSPMLLMLLLGLLQALVRRVLSGL